MLQCTLRVAYALQCMHCCKRKWSILFATFFCRYAHRCTAISRVSGNGNKIHCEQRPPTGCELCTLYIANSLNTRRSCVKNLSFFSPAFNFGGSNLDPSRCSLFIAHKSCRLNFIAVLLLQVLSKESRDFSSFLFKER